MAKKPPKVRMRKPPATAPAAADTFVAGEGPKPRTLVTRASGKVVNRTTIYLSPELAQRVRVYCATHGRELSDLVSEALAQIVGE